MKGMKRIVSFFIIIIGMYFAAWADVDVRSSRLTVTDGLANNSVRCIYQDQKGFIWFGTLDGLNRYDGSSFLTFLPERGKGVSLSDHRMYRLAEDKNGFLWIRHTPSVFSCYDLKKGQVVDFTGCGENMWYYAEIYVPRKADEDVWLWGSQKGCRRVMCRDGVLSSESFRKGKGLPTDAVNHLQPDGKGGVWIATPEGIYHWTEGEMREAAPALDIRYIHVHQGKAYFFATDGTMYASENGDRVKRLDKVPVRKRKVDFDGYIFYRDEWMIYSSAGNFCFNFTQGRFVKPHPKLDVHHVQIIEDNKLDFWIYNHTGTVRYVQAESGEVREFRLMSDENLDYIDEERYSIVHDSRGLLWIATYGRGLYVYDLKTGGMQHFTVGERGGTDNVISSDYLLCLMEDRLGNMWVSSEFTGIDKLSILNPGAFHVYPNGKEKINRSNTVRSLSCLNGSDIYIATRTGDVIVYDTLFSAKHVLKANTNVYAVEKDAEGRVWYGTRGKGVMVGDEQYSHHAGDPASLSSNQVYNLYKDSRGRMWVATLGGGLNLAIREDGVYRFRSFFLKEGENRVRAVCEDANGWMWMGTDKGVFVFRPEELLNNPDAYYNYTLENGDLYSNEIRSIVRDSRGCMWIAETGAGFSYCMPGEDYARLEFTHYGMTDGLVNNMVQDFVEDLRGDMWISTEYGISCFDREAGLFENYFFSTNVLGNIYTENCGIRLPDGRLAFGTNYGLNIINPGALAEEVGNESTVTFTDLKLDGVSVRPGDEHSPLESALPYVSEIKLPYYQNSFVIDFSTLDYVRQGIQKFIYRLEGYEKTWSKPSPLSFAAYKNLRPGTYRLRVKASNALGVWSGKESVLKITVKPPFWKTGWAYLAYALLAGGLLYVAFSIFSKMNALRNQIKVEEQLTEYKLVFFTNISHEFRTPLTLIQNALEKIHRAGKLPREIASSVSLMDKSTGRMLRLINQLLEFRKMQNNKLALSLEETDVVAFLYEIFLSFSDAAESKNMDFQFVPSRTSYTMFIDKGHLDKVTYNLLSNAFKYTPSGGKVTFTVDVDEERKKLVITVRDTGVGIPPEKRNELFKRFMQSSFSGSSVGVGLHLSHELVCVHKGTIEFSENEGGGSVFTVTLPTDPSVYEEKDFLIPHNVLLEEERKHQEQVAAARMEADIELPEVEPINKKRVLIIEDDNDVREFLKEEVGRYFEVMAEADGVAGLARAREYDADLIICDVLMPGMTGFEVTRKLKNDFNTSHIPIILLTAMNSAESHLAGVESGADAYITKPFSPKLLLARAFKLIEQREKLKEKFSNAPNMLRPTICSSDKDKAFADQLQAVVEQQLENAQFTVDEFASIMGLGRTVFYRKVRGVTGYSPNEYIRIVRMKKAAELLLESNYTVSEVSYKVGINDPFYFSKCFKHHFGVSPSAYREGTAAKPGETPAGGGDEA